MFCLQLFKLTNKLFISYYHSKTKKNNTPRFCRKKKNEKK